MPIVITFRHFQLAFISCIFFCCCCFIIILCEKIAFASKMSMNQIIVSSSSSLEIGKRNLSPNIIMQFIEHKRNEEEKKKIGCSSYMYFIKSMKR